MEWTAGLGVLYAKHNPTAPPQTLSEISTNESALFFPDTPVLLYRRSKRTRDFPSSSGSTGWDGSGSLTMSAIGASPDVIYIDDSFYSIAQTEISLPSSSTLQLQSKAPGGLSLFRKKGPLANWRTKGNAPEDVVLQLAQLIRRIDPEYPHFYELKLLPHGEGSLNHTLLVRTDKLPWELGRFSASANYIRTDEEGRRLGSNDTALHCMENLLRIAAEAHTLFS